MALEIFSCLDKKMSRFKYPKFALLILTFLLAYEIFANNDMAAFREFVLSSGYLGIFIAGTLFSYGFTTAIAIALFIIFAPYNNIWITALLGGFGALCSDFIIFKIIRNNFDDEIRCLKKEYLIRQIIKEANHTFSKKVRHYLTMILAGVILASPLPDEIGVMMFAASTRISARLFYLFSYMFNTMGIFIILMLGNSIS